jgi:FkbM family methyltransferase
MTRHFFDIGANVGQSLDEFLCKRPEFDGAAVWLFEPSPRHVPALMERCATFSSRYKIRVCPFAVSSSSGVFDFYQKDDPRGDSLFEKVKADHEQANISPGFGLRVATVGVVNLVLHCTEPGDKVVLKLDCEGAEYGILSALLGSPAAIDRLDSVLVEWHTVDVYSHIFTPDVIKRGFANVDVPLLKWMF